MMIVMNVYQIITQRIIERINRAEETGEPFHWIKPWTGGCTLPMSYTSGKPYHGVNLLLLDSGCEYITYKAVQELNEVRAEDDKLYVKKGAHTIPVVFFNNYDLKDDEGNQLLDEYGNPAKKWYARYYSVFSREDVKNLHSHYPAERVIHTTSKETKLLDKYINAYAKAEGLTMDIVEDGVNCFYKPSQHLVRVPAKEGFKSIYAYYSSVLHEIIHSTSKGMGRQLGKGFGTDTYSREELIAQIGSQMLLNRFKITCDETEEDNDIAYISGWASHLKEHEREITRAAIQAERAMDYFVDVAEQQINKRKQKPKAS
jgi:antirestriction protein ArdC